MQVIFPETVGHPAVTFIVKELVPPAGTLTIIVAPTEAVNVAVAVWRSEVLFPVMSTVNTPAEVGMQASDAVAGARVALTLTGVTVPQPEPSGIKVAFRLTMPLKPLAFVTVIIEVAVPAAVALTAAGEEALIEKSTPKVKVAVAL